MKTASTRLRHRLTLQQEVETPDNVGGFIRSWQDVAQLWAEIIPVSTSGVYSGREIPVAGQAQSEVSHRVSLRYRSGVTAGMRLMFEQRVFNIRYVVNMNEDNEILQLLVQEGVAP